MTEEKKKETITFDLDEFKEFIELFDRFESGTYKVDENGYIHHYWWGNNDYLIKGEING